MTLQTRSMAKSPPGRSTRNSVYGRSPLPPTKSPKSSKDTSPVKPPILAQATSAHDTGVGGSASPEINDAQNVPWLSCRDTHGVFTTIAVSETGAGVHLRWHYPDDDRKADEDAQMSTVIDEGRDVTPIAMAGDNVARLLFPQTPMEPQPYDAGSVIETPVKRAKPLQRSPTRIGDKGIRCLFEKDGVLKDPNGRARVVLRHPVGSPMNLTREQVERLEDEREGKIIQVQVEKLLAKKNHIGEGASSSDTGYEEETETDASSSQRRLVREETNDTIPVSSSDLDVVAQPVPEEENKNTFSVFRGAHGELLDRHGHQVLGSEGTILIDSTYAFPRKLMREESFLTWTGVAHTANLAPNGSSGSHRPRFGPEGTELID